MIIGLVLLAIAAVLVFFGLTRAYFRRIGVAPWVAFLVILALIVGAVVPSIPMGIVRMNVGAFIIPAVLSIILMFMIGWNIKLLRAAIALIAVAGVAVATRMLIMPDTVGMQITAAVIVGIIGGIVAYLIAGTRTGTITATLGGVVLGDMIVSLLYHYVTGYTPATIGMGAFGVFDGVIIATVFGIVLCELAMGARRRPAKSTRSVLDTEAGQDNVIDNNILIPEDKDGFDDYFNDDID